MNLVSNPRTIVLPALMGPDRLARFRPFQSFLRRVDGLLYEEIAERRHSADLAQREDIMSLLLQARHPRVESR